MSSLEFIKECQEKVFSGIGISSDDAKKLFNIPDENIQDLARCANEITREFNGDKVDVEQLNNIKKNADCPQNVQSSLHAFFLILFNCSTSTLSPLKSLVISFAYFAKS